MGRRDHYKDRFYKVSKKNISEAEVEYDVFYNYGFLENKTYNGSYFYFKISFIAYLML